MNTVEQTLAELRAVQQQMTSLYNAGEIDSYFEYIHNDVIYNLPIPEGVLRGKAAVRAWYDAYLSRHEYVYWQSDPVPVVVGSAGVLSGPFTFKVKPVGQNEQTLQGQHTVFFSQVDGTWVKVGEHASFQQTAAT